MNKNILLICPKFHNYDQIIYNSLESSSKYLIADTLSDNIILKIIIRYTNPYFNNLYSLLYYYKYRDILIKDYNKILIIRGECISKRLVNKLNCEKSNITFYMWDSIRNYPHLKKILPLIKKFYTFDPNDAIKYGGTYKQLFNDNKVEKSVIKDIYFFSASTLFFKRLYKIYKISSNIDKRNIIIIYCRNKYLFFIVKIIFKIFKSNVILSRRRLSNNEYFSLMIRSNAVIDIPDSNQSGLSMRAVACLANGCKLFTSNYFISQNPTVDSSQYVIIEGNKLTENNIINEVSKFHYEDITQWIKSML